MHRLSGCGQRCLAGGLLAVLPRLGGGCAKRLLRDARSVGGGRWGARGGNAGRDGGGGGGVDFEGIMRQGWVVVLQSLANTTLSASSQYPVGHKAELHLRWGGCHRNQLGTCISAQGWVVLPGNAT